jgi:hypothetical protein
MNLDEVYKMLGYGLVCLFIVYITAQSIRFQLGIVEGLVGRKTEKESTPTATAEAMEPNN